MSCLEEKVVVATRNRKKTDEIRAMLAGLCEVRDVCELENAGVCLPEIAEIGTTFVENATLKAVGISRVVAGLVLADDSGLEVDGLGGAPGVWSSSYGGEEGNHALNNARLVAELASVPEAERTGRFRCAMVLARGGLPLGEFAGTVEGRLLTAPRGEDGFGYDPYFVPEGHEGTFAELGLELKNQMSHRARALRQVVEFLATSRV